MLVQLPERDLAEDVGSETLSTTAAGFDEGAVAAVRIELPDGAGIDAGANGTDARSRRRSAGACT
jgi:hypothetical protein